MRGTKAARRSCNYDRARASATADANILSDWERGTLWAGRLMGASLAIMGLIGGALGW